VRDREELLLLLLIIRIHINDTCNLVPRLCSPLHLQHAEQEDEHSIHSYIHALPCRRVYIIFCAPSYTTKFCVLQGSHSEQ
jgi:hypothetical protein